MAGLGHLVVVLWILFHVWDDFIRRRITEGTGWSGDDDGEGMQAWSQLRCADSGQPSGELPSRCTPKHRRNLHDGSGDICAVQRDANACDLVSNFQRRLSEPCVRRAISRGSPVIAAVTVRREGSAH